MQLNESFSSKRLSPNGRNGNNLNSSGGSNNKLRRENSSGMSITSSSQVNLRSLIRAESYNGGFVDLLFKEHALAMSLSHSFRFRPKPFTRPRLKEVLSLIQVALRCREHLKSCREKCVDSFIEFFTPTKLRQGYGVPLGGIGTGTIGRTSTGDFARYQLVPGMYEHETVDANMFTVCLRKTTNTVYQQALTTRRSKLKGLRSWNMAYCGDYATYFALYPEAWSTYDLPGHHVTLTCHQVSPVIAHNYKDSSLPVSLFSWTIENKNKEDLEVSIMFTWQAGSASDKFTLTDVSSRSFDNYTNSNQTIAGVSISQKLKNMPLEYCIAAKKNPNVKITYNCQFYPDHEASGTDLWLDLLTDGKLDNNEFDAERSQRNGNTRLAVAVCVTVLVRSASKEKVDFSLVWHMPEISFTGAPNRLYKRFYTRYFPNSSSAALDISCYAFDNYSRWLDALLAWRKPIFYNRNLSNFLKCCLFNELYFISDGGTVWVDVNDDEKLHPMVREYGRFAYLEGHEYRMYNTYDVHFYANFALVQLWPKLQLGMQYDFAASIDQESTRRAKFIYEGKSGQIKVRGSMPHDIGDPEDRPWDHLNAYVFHDTKDWKDLNLKFILTVFRDFSYLRDVEYLKYMWPYIKTLMITVQSQDQDGDGLIDSEGLPDQTYDAWSVTGASAYCGGLHVATLVSVVEMARELNDTETQKKYEEILTRARQAYNDKLWNGEYYKYDCSNSGYHDSIMADMCCGHWYLRCSGMKYEGFEKEKIAKCLKKIHEYNVIRYGNGKRGAVNGMRPNGSVDITSLQSEEMWIGITDALASLMIYEGMEREACQMLEAMYEMLYNQLGLAFQTPEALVRTSTFRSLGYMRPLCVWSVLYAFENRDDTSL